MHAVSTHMKVDFTDQHTPHQASHQAQLLSLQNLSLVM